MQGISLDRTVAIYRSVMVGSQFQDTLVYPSVRCAIVPISKFDAAQPYAYESTHIVWVPYWMTLRKEDRVHAGIRPPDPQGDALLPYIYTVQGRREFRLGIPQVAYYAREKE